MPDRSSTNKTPSAERGVGNRSKKRGQGPRDLNEIAFDVVRQATGEARQPEPGEKNSAAVTLGRLGGLKGGQPRAKTLTAEERKEIAKKAALARWKSQKGGSTGAPKSGHLPVREE
jgi:hypothetical protein